MSCLHQDVPNAHRLVGDPIDAVTGANTEVAPDFTLPGPIPLKWRRHYDSSRAGACFALGWGHSHEYERTLRFDVDGIRYTGPLGSSISFPPLNQDGARASSAGRTLRRVGAFRYEIAEADLATMEFELTNAFGPAPLSALVRGRARIEFRYAADGALQGIVDSTGRSVRVERDTVGRVLRLTLTGAQGRDDRDLVVYSYDEAGNLVHGLDAYRHSFSFAYDAAHRMIRRTDRRGYSFYFSYDGLGRCVHSRGEDGLYEVRLNYHPEERRTLVTQTDGGVWQYKCNEDGLLTEIVDPYSGVRAFRYDALGRVIEEVDPNGDVTQWVYKSSGRLLGKLSSLGHFSSGADGLLRPDQQSHGRLRARLSGSTATCLRPRASVRFALRQWSSPGWLTRCVGSLGTFRNAILRRPRSSVMKSVMSLVNWFERSRRMGACGAGITTREATPSDTATSTGRWSNASILRGICLADGRTQSVERLPGAFRRRRASPS